MTEVAKAVNDIADTRKQAEAIFSAANDAGTVVVSRRNATLDCLRGIAIALVLLLHFHLSYPFTDAPFGKWLTLISRNGNYGVVMFFVISGAVITAGILARYGTLDGIIASHFYVRRVARVLPNLVLFLCTCAILQALGFTAFRNSASGPSLWLTWISALTFWHNVLMAFFGYFNYAINILWSLSVEEMFYLLLPLACLVLRSRPRFLLLIACFVLLGPVYRWFYRADEIEALYSYLACFDAIALGCATAIFLTSGFAWQRWSMYCGIAGCCLMIAVYLHSGISDDAAWGVSAMSFGTSLMIVASASPAGEAVGLRMAFFPLRTLGVFSYELYLAHIVVLGVLRGWISPASLAGEWKIPVCLSYISISVMLAIMLGRVSLSLNRKLRSRLLSF